MILNANGEPERPSTATPEIAEMFIQLAQRANTSGLPLAIVVCVNPQGEVEVAAGPIVGHPTPVLALVGALEKMKMEVLMALGTAMNRKPPTKQ